MADIRIKDLAVTAGSSASDDYLAVDGATNGTRKLNAYSPTFGGNLTVSGSADRLATVETTGSSNAAVLRLKSGNGTTSAQYAYLQLISNETSGQTWNFGMYGEKPFTIRDGSTAFVTIANSTGNATLAGNLTVSGTGTSTFNGLVNISKASAAPSLSAASGAFNVTQFDLVSSLQFGGYNTAPYALWMQTTNNSGSSFPLAINPLGGNLLVGTATDSGNGKLQLANHTASTGGIGFGTDTSLYRATAQSLNLDGASSPQFSLSVSGTQKARFESYTDDLYISTLTAGKSIILRSGNATTALTLDSSQNVYGSADNTYFSWDGNSNRIGITKQSGSVGKFTYGSASSFTISQSSGTTIQASNTFTDRFTLDSSGNATFTGSIAIGNTVQTAVSVASTHKVTISIGGSTYYLLATNV